MSCESDPGMRDTMSFYIGYTSLANQSLSFSRLVTEKGFFAHVGPGDTAEGRSGHQPLFSWKSCNKARRASQRGASVSNRGNGRGPQVAQGRRRKEVTFKPRHEASTRRARWQVKGGPRREACCAGFSGRRRRWHVRSTACDGERRRRARVCALASVRQGVREYVYVCVRVSRPTSVCVRVCVVGGECIQAYESG